METWREEGGCDSDRARQIERQRDRNSNRESERGERDTRDCEGVSEKENARE